MSVLVTWEAVLDDGTVIREAEGKKYVNLPLEHLEMFRLVSGSEFLFQTQKPPGAPGTAFRYRRGIEIAPGADRVEMFRLGWEPHGPAFLIDAAAVDDDRPGVWVSGYGFHDQSACVCEVPHPFGWFAPPMRVGAER